MAKDFIKKNWQKDATDNLINSGIRIGGGFAASWAIHKFFNIKKGSDGKEQKTMYNIGGPLLVALGVMGDMMIDEPKVKAFCQGLATYGGVHAIAVLAPDTLQGSGGWGIQGIDGGCVNGVGALGTTTENQAANLMGDVEDMLSLAAGKKEVKDTDGKTYNNDWAYLAENIDHADEITKNVSGVEPTPAELMGTDTDEEAALLMGMF